MSAGVPVIGRLADHPRVTVRRAGAPVPEGRCVVYWMQRAQRGRDNPALDVAIDAANALGRPVVVFFAPVPFYPHANLRHYQFLFDGVPDLARELERRGVGLVFRWFPDHSLARFCEEVRPALVVGDENPLREPRQWRERAANRLRAPLWTVDADVVVPTRLLEKEQYAARTLRPRIRKLLPRFLVEEREPTARSRWKAPRGLVSRRPTGQVPDDFPIDRATAPVTGFRGGPAEARRRPQRFVKERLHGYAGQRNHPDVDGTSRLSPYLHFGHLGPRSMALAVSSADAPRVDRDVLLEELIVRRELAVNFVHFNPEYDSLAGCEGWAIRTLDLHRRDLRPIVYGEATLEAAETHDPLWNAAQRQMVESGWMHGYLRMYWAKKILEWTLTPEEAFAIAVRLNDRYELDGRDPNGYAGIAWAIGGKHDRAWGPERPVFGTVRFMSYESTRRKFDSRAYIRRWSGTSAG